jgi:DNA-binding transcriptional LysR family regulator
MIEMGELEAFLVTADELHFGRAAKRLFLSPSRVSQLIRQLENRVGAKLFDRTTRQVRLTPVGEQLNGDLQAVYTDLVTALRRAEAAGRGLEGIVRIGYLTHCSDKAFTSLLTGFGGHNPAGRVVTLDITGADYFTELSNGAVDVILGRFHETPPPDLVRGPVISEEEWVVAVAAGHPLSGRDLVDVEELAHYAIFGVPDSVTGEVANPLYPAITPGGAPIPRRGVARTLAEVLALVGSGESVLPVGESFPLYYNRPDVVFVPLRGWPPASRHLVWRAHGNVGIVNAFIDLALGGAGMAAERTFTPGYGDWPGPRVLGDASS